MKYSFLLISILTSVLFSCSPKEKISSLEKDLVGEWRNIYLKVTLNVNGDSTRITECDSVNWEKMLGIKPIRTFFNADGTYTSKYYTLQDSLFRTSGGNWKVSGDTLIMEQVTPGKEIYALRTTVSGSVASFEGPIDFDGDGKRDDFYLGRQRKQ